MCSVPGVVRIGKCGGGGADECVSVTSTGAGAGRFVERGGRHARAGGSFLIEQGDASLLPRLEELRANADRSLRLAIKPVIDTWRHRANLASPDAETRRTAATDLGMSGRPAAISWLQTAAANESHRWARYAMEESALLLQLASDNPAVNNRLR